MVGITYRRFPCASQHQYPICVHQLPPCIDLLLDQTVASSLYVAALLRFPFALYPLLDDKHFLGLSDKMSREKM